MPIRRILLVLGENVMPTVTFRAKLENVFYADETLAYTCVKVPAIKHSHCDMNAFRNDKNFGSYANSDLFLGMVKGALKKLGVKEYIKLGELPQGVTVNTSGFIALVTIEVTSWR